MRESRDELAAVREALAGQAGELRALRARLAELEVPWLWRCGPNPNPAKHILWCPGTHCVILWATRQKQLHER